MILLYILTSLLVIFGIFALVYITSYNILIGKKIKINEAEFSIDETLREKYDLIIRISKSIKSNTDINVDYFKEFETLKNKKISNFNFDRKIKEAINLVMQLKNDYPTLENNKDMKDALATLKSSEEKLEAAKNYYNKYTTEINMIIRKFPSNIVARFHGIQTKSYFDGKDMEDDITDDFKL